MSYSNTYTTMQNDAWDAIAYRLWGDERLFHHIMKANPRHQDVILFEAGVELVIPDRPENFAAFELPPWRRSK